MNVLQILGSNPVLNIALLSFALAQMLKMIFTLLITGKLDFERLLGAGGMPSSHSAMTSALAIAIERAAGFSSPTFALAVCFAGIVMYDAMGVRRAAGEQAKVLNKMIFDFPFFRRQLSDGEPPAADQEAPLDKGDTQTSTVNTEDDEGHPLIPKELKEFLGHTPTEVLGGCLLGIMVAIVMPV